MNNTFGENLKRIRIKNDLKQSELAEKMGYKQVTISSWENNRTLPKIDELEKLCEALNCSQYELLEIKKEPGEITFDDILVKINTLNVPQLDLLVETVSKQKEILIELKNLEMQKLEYERKLALYAEKIAKLKGNIK